MQSSVKEIFAKICDGYKIFIYHSIWLQMVLKQPPWHKASINIFADQIGQEMREVIELEQTDRQTERQTPAVGVKSSQREIFAKSMMTRKYLSFIPFGSKWS